MNDLPRVHVASFNVAVAFCQRLLDDLMAATAANGKLSPLRREAAGALLAAVRDELDAAHLDAQGEFAAVPARRP